MDRVGGRGRPEDLPVRWRRALALLAGVPLAFLLQALARRAPEWTESVYARGIFPALRDACSALASLSPVSVAETLVALALVSVGLLVARGSWLWWRGRRSVANLAARAAARTAIAAGVLTSAFMLLWGLNYARRPFARLAGWELRPASVDELRATADSLVERIAAVRPGLWEDDEGVVRLRLGREGVLAELPAAFEAAARVHAALGGPPPLVRLPLASPLLTAAGITGVYSPFTAEAHVNAETPAVSLPFTACHEVAHERGFAREDEANFIAYRVCTLSAEPELRYSGLLGALDHVLGALARADPGAAAEVLAALPPGVLRDREAVAAFWSARGSSAAARVLSEAVWRTNDAFLRSQGQTAGVASYGRMVDLLVAEQRAGAAR